MLIELTHPEDNYEFWIDYDEISALERYNKPKTILINPDGNKPSVTAMVMKNGRVMSCKETPAQIFKIMANAVN